MSLTSAGAIATRSLGVISDQINLTSRNVAGAGVAGVTTKHANLESDDAGVDFIGVGRATDTALFRNLLSASAYNEAAGAVSDTLSRIDKALNLSDSSNSRSAASLISKLKGALQTYSATPQNQTAAQLAISAAQDVAGALRDATAAAQQERRAADEGTANAVSEVNELLGKFGDLNAEIVQGTVAGADVTDALDRRDALLGEITKRIGVTAVSRANNDTVIYTDSGVTLFETTPRQLTFRQTPTLSPGSTGAAVYIDGVQVTGAGAPLALRAGGIVGLVQIRDDIAPLLQNQLDEIARGLVVAFAERDQSGAGGPDLPGLFTYATATQVPAATLLPGLAGQIALNASVDPRQGGDVSRLRDGGISGNPAYVYNTSGAPGYANRLIELVNATSRTQSFDPAAGLGGGASVDMLAAGSNGWIAARRQQTESSTTYYGAVVSQTTQALSNATGVNLDDQMSQMLALENSYQASAKLLEAVNSMFNALFAALHA